MTSDILLIRLSLRSDPKVMRLAELLTADVDLIVGKLVNLWGYVQTNGDAGVILYADRARVDNLVAMPGFSDALVRINWLHFDLVGANVVGYEQYLGTEGMRALVEEWLKHHPRKRGRRSHPAEPGFTDFWSEYPRKVAQKAALKAWRALDPDETLRLRMMDALRLDKRSNRWVKDKGEFIPYPATWINQERWTDDRSAAAAVPGRVVAPTGKYAHLSGAAAATGTPAADPDPQGQGTGAGGTLFAQDHPPPGSG